MILGSLCETAYTEGNSDVFTPIKFNSSNMLDNQGNFHAITWFLSKYGSTPVSACLDIDGTTFFV